MFVMVTTLLLVAHAKPVDVSPVIPTGETIRLDERFDITTEERSESFHMSGHIHAIQGGVIGEVPMTWRFVNLQIGPDGPRDVPASFELSFQADGSPSHDWERAAGHLLSDEITTGVLVDQFRLFPFGRRNKKETWTAKMQSSFFGGPLDLTWTVADVTRDTVRVSVVGTGSALRDKLKIEQGYSLVGEVTIDRATQLPILSEATWKLKTSDRAITLKVVRTLAITDHDPTPRITPQGVSQAMATLDAVMPDAQGREHESREVIVARFREARAVAGTAFEEQLLPLLGQNLERHYWSAGFLTSRDYLHGDAPDAALALRLTERALSLVPMISDCDDRVHQETALRFQAARYAQRLGFTEIAVLHKSRFEALLATGESAAMGSVPAVYEDERATFEQIDVIAVPPVSVDCEADRHED